MKKVTVGVLAFHGDVAEHLKATKRAALALNLKVDVVPVRTKESLRFLDALIIPGGESTTLYKLAKREGIWREMRQINYIFGTCAGAIMLARKVTHKTPDQKTLALMDIEIDRNAYGRQMESFEKKVETTLGKINAVFIRAPRILKIGKTVSVLAKIGKEAVACDEQKGKSYYLAACFHPELSTTLFHQYFLKKISS